MVRLRMRLMDSLLVQGKNCDVRYLIYMEFKCQDLLLLLGNLISMSDHSTSSSLNNNVVLQKLDFLIQRRLET